ncbi:PhnA domain-containing protein [Portibacter lacus]|uniref:PhnA domain protein n=1 Tax=Portibacter lacus TaxID=1099794 RepID=A0AA37SQN7_9BACT|nr:alkylphosphonate utilization protein [Portibacter lacus]GLR18067.1 PhnA domain protein [Portibacter lacus]
MLLKELAERSENKCELCTSPEDLSAYTVPPKNSENTEDQIALCSNCLGQVTDYATIDTNHMRCVNESMWSVVPAVQVVSYRLLKQMQDQSWAQDAIGMIYMDDETREWADAQADAAIIHKDSNGHVLENGDTVVLIKDLSVKGGGFTAKRGTAVRRIRLDPDNANHIEGKVEGQQIVILTEYVKKS